MGEVVVCDTRTQGDFESLHARVVHELFWPQPWRTIAWKMAEKDPGAISGDGFKGAVLKLVEMDAAEAPPAQWQRLVAEAAVRRPRVFLEVLEDREVSQVSLLKRVAHIEKTSGWDAAVRFLEEHKRGISRNQAKRMVVAALKRYGDKDNP